MAAQAAGPVCDSAPRSLTEVRRTARRKQQGLDSKFGSAVTGPCPELWHLASGPMVERQAAGFELQRPGGRMSRGRGEIPARAGRGWSPRIGSRELVSQNSAESGWLRITLR